MDLNQLRKDAIDLANNATALEDEDKPEEAIRCYVKTVNILKRLIEYDTNKYNLETYNKRCASYEERIDYLKKLVDQNSRKIVAGGGNDK
jgi:tetratricopeptide (TPR) repeat protein